MISLGRKRKNADPQRVKPRAYRWCELCGRDKDVIYDQGIGLTLCPYCDPVRSPQLGKIPQDLFLTMKILEALYHEITYVQRYKAEGFIEWSEQRDAVRLIRSAIPAHFPTQYSLSGKPYQRPPVWPGMHDQRWKEWCDLQDHRDKMARLKMVANEAAETNQWLRRSRIEAKRKIREAKRARKAEAANRRERFLRLMDDVST